MLQPRLLLRQMFDAAIEVAQPDRIVPKYLPEPPKGRTVVVGAGKAAAAMARALERHWPLDRPLEGLVVTRYGCGVGALRRIGVLEAGHPVPDAAGQTAATRILSLVGGLGSDDLVICLLSGGGSALLSLPAAGIDLTEKQELNRALLRSGATIGEINCVRKHLSAIKAGRLAAAAAPARVVSLIISDVPGDDPSVIASGPTEPDRTTAAEARAVLDRYRIEPSSAIRARLADPAAETPKPSDAIFEKVVNHVIATPQTSLEAAAAVAQDARFVPLILGDSIEGESSAVARVMSGIARQVMVHGQPLAAPCVLISGGETTVTVRGNGVGGRNVEFLLALAIDLRGLRGVYAIAGDTDGVDGASDVAGAIVTPDTLARAAAIGFRPRDALERNDAHTFFGGLGDQVVTGPTRTNVNDFRAILILGQADSPN